MCPSCGKAYCEAHLRNHNVATTTTVMQPVNCGGNRFRDPTLNVCFVCKGNPQKTVICETCMNPVCSAHVNRHASTRASTSTTTTPCSGYTEAIQSMVLTGKIPKWTFGAAVLPLPSCLGFSGPKKPLVFSAKTETPVLVDLPNLYRSDWDQALAALAESDPVQKAILDCGAECAQELQPGELFAALKNSGYLGAIVNGLRASPMAKRVCVAVMRRILRDLKGDYDMLLAEAQGEVTGTTPILSSSGASESWSEELERFSNKSASATTYTAADLPAYCIVDMTDNACWLKATAIGADIRNRVVATHKETGMPIKHLTFYKFDGCVVIAVNSKTWDGSGTTRMQCLVTKSPQIVEKDFGVLKDCQLRVLDLSYRDMARLTLNLCQEIETKEACSKSAAHAQLGQLILGVLENDPTSIETLKKTSMNVGLQYTSFLKGVRINSKGELELDDIFWLSKKSKSVKNLDDLGFKMTGYETVCNLLSIILIAETRHSLAMYPSTLMMLHEVAEGRLTFEHMFSNANGAIQCGRLLPGANVLGPFIVKPKGETHRRAVELFKKVAEKSKGEYPLVTPCFRKALAMPLSVAPLYDDVYEDPPEGMLHSIRKFMEDPQFAYLPECEPTLKVLAAPLLRFMSSFTIPSCVMDMTPCTTQIVEIPDEEDEHEQDLIDENEDFGASVLPSFKG